MLPFRKIYHNIFQACLLRYGLLIIGAFPCSHFTQRFLLDTEEKGMP
jgi:hypothetical protein